jgi:manganese/zinc/iron transport system permease protein
MIAMENSAFSDFINYFLHWNWWVLPSLALLAFSLGKAGSYMLYARQTLLGDVMAHAALPGVCMVYSFMGSDQTLEWLLLGGTLGGIFAIGLYFVLIRFFNVEIDSALGLVLSLGFSAGIMWLGSLLRTAPGSDLEHLLWGEAGGTELPHFYLWLVMTLLMIFFSLYYGRFRRFSTFDPEFIKVSGKSVFWLDLSFYLLYSLVLSAALFSAGLMLVMAFVSLPGLCVSQISHRPAMGAWLAGLLAASATIIPSIATYFFEFVLPGPWTVVLMFMFYGVLVIFNQLKWKYLWP